MDINEFLEQVRGAPPAKLEVPTTDLTPSRAPGELDALFELPLLALSALIIAQNHPFKTNALGRNVAALLVEHFSALQGAPRLLENSLTLRRRCAEALAFLEAARLVSVSPGRERFVTVTTAGSTLLRDARRDTTDLGLLTRRLRGSQVRSSGRHGSESPT
jgi:hypothetical protein